MTISFPRLNPLTFKEEYKFPYENHTESFVQEFDKSDPIVFQLSHNTDFNTDEIEAYLIDYNGGIIAPFEKITIQLDAFIQQVIFRGSFDVEEGFYRIFINAGSKFSCYSNTIYIHDTENTLLLQYRCKENKFDCLFKSTRGAESFYLRIPGGIKTSGYSFKSDDIEFIDQNRKVTLLSSIPYTIRKYIFGGSMGIPLWLADKLNRIFSCDEIEIDGIKTAKNNGAALELTSQENYKYVGASIELLYLDEGYSEKPDIRRRIHTAEFTAIFN